MFDRRNLIIECCLILLVCHFLTHEELDFIGTGLFWVIGIAAAVVAAVWVWFKVQDCVDGRKRQGKPPLSRSVAVWGFWIILIYGGLTLAQKGAEDKARQAAQVAQTETPPWVDYAKR